ncbi:adenylosuccinate synthase [Phycisphaerales bacterium AB-hyl4]|uniref:Adenylosuccinate synthetase n=1 Tax=Natronomicrosphaera hydrolytica TaxID=3242702 RepID=A0ABV4U3H6_9BACT
MSKAADATAGPGSAVTAAADGGAVLNKLGLEAGHTAIVGLQWGDEGKGKVVDLIAGATAAQGGGGFDCVVRYNGGANAGHSLQVGDQRYALHLVPSGILYPEKINVLGNGVVIDPAQLVKEITELKSRGIAVGENLRISDRAHVVFEYHKVQDVLYDQAVAKAWGSDKPIGTTGRGIGPCYADKALRSTAIRVADMLDTPRLRDMLPRIVSVKNGMLKSLADLCGQSFEPLDADALLATAIEHAEALRPHVCDTATLLHDAMSGGRRLLFEGANATLLDIDHGTYPYVTSSNCSSLGVHTGTGVPGHRVTNVVGIVKAYQTRVGGGPMPTQLDDEIGDRIREKGREYGTTTGRPRRCGWLDLVALKYTAAVSGATGIALMLLDVLAGLEELKVCVGYRHQGRVLKTFPADADVLAAVEPVYETLPGFAAEIEDCRSYNDLPEEAKAYIRRIEQFIDVPVVMASVGPRRDQSVFR